MPTTTPVVVAIGPRGSTAAVEYAAGEAVRLHRDLHVVHAADTPELESVGALVLERAVRQAVGRVAGAVEVTSRIAVGPPVPAVVAAAEGAPLVVVGRCPEEDHVHPYVPSITGGVAARAVVPVVSVPDDWTRPAGPPHVVVGVDDPAENADVLLEAFTVARSQQARLTVLSAWWRPTGAGSSPITQVDDADLPTVVRADLRTVTADLSAAYPDVPVEILVRNRPPRDALVEASGDASLVVLGRHDPVLPTGSHLGPVARAVLRESPSPVLLVAPRHAHRVHRAASRREQPA